MEIIYKDSLHEQESYWLVMYLKKEYEKTGSSVNSSGYIKGDDLSEIEPFKGLLKRYGLEKPSNLERTIVMEDKEMCVGELMSHTLWDLYTLDFITILREVFYGETTVTYGRDTIMRG